MAASYQSCFPNGGLPTCASGCPYYPAPVLTFPNQNLDAISSLVASEVRPGDLSHGQIVTLNHATYYEFSGSNFLHLGEQDYISFSPHPRFPISQLFQWSFQKYPYVGNDVAPDGSVPYASPGLTIREGDFVFLQNIGAQRATAQVGAPNPYNLPFVSVPTQNVVSDFSSYGSMAPTNMRIISETFDPSIPSSQQPAIKLDGSKAYFLQFTRTQQNLALYPGMQPAPCFVHTSAFKGNGTRWIILPINWHYNLPANAPIPYAVPPPTPLRPEQVAATGVSIAGAAVTGNEIGRASCRERVSSPV